MSSPCTSNVKAGDVSTSPIGALSHYSLDMGYACRGRTAARHLDIGRVGVVGVTIAQINTRDGARRAENSDCGRSGAPSTTYRHSRGVVLAWPAPQFVITATPV